MVSYILSKLKRVAHFDLALMDVASAVPGKFCVFRNMWNMTASLHDFQEVL